MSKVRYLTNKATSITFLILTEIVTFLTAPIHTLNDRYTFNDIRRKALVLTNCFECKILYFTLLCFYTIKRSALLVFGRYLLTYGYLLKEVN